jgi:Uma2 family endonuclease
METGYSNAPVATDTLVTGEDLAKMGDIGRAELVEGNIIMRSPTGWRHGKYERRFAQTVGHFVDEKELGEVLVGEVGIYTGRNPDTVRGADVIFISTERLAQVKSASFLDVGPELVIEIMSPDDRWSEVRKKIREYFSIGAVLVWVADPSDYSVSVYRSPTDVEILTEKDTLTGEKVLPGFKASVAALFAD